MIQKYKKNLIPDLNVVSIEELKLKSSELEKYLSTLKDRKVKQNDRDEFLTFLYKYIIYNYIETNQLEYFHI